MATTELVLVCHGEAACDFIHVVGGSRACTGLTPRGDLQAQLVADRLADAHAHKPFAACCTSPRRCAQQTAQIVGKVLRPHIDDGIRGLDPGDAEGQPREQVQQAFGGTSEHRSDDPLASGAETRHEYLGRATAGLGSVHRRHRGSRIAIVGHPETIVARHILPLGLPADVRIGLRLRTEPAGVSR